jgi:hypothetical protein
MPWAEDNVIKLIQPGLFDDQLTESLRNGARALLAKRSRPRKRTFSTSKSAN